MSRGPGRARRLVHGTVGGVVGVGVGFFLTLAIFVAEARAGRYVYSLDDLTLWRWEALPTWTGLVTGAVVAWRAPRLAWGVLWRGLAVAALAGAAGWGVGPLVWVGRSAPWAGAVLGAAGGLLVGLAAAGAAWARRRRVAPRP